MGRLKILLLALCFAVTGCPPEPPPSPSPAEQLKLEQQKRKEAEARRDKEAASRGDWQAVAFITGIGAVLLLIVGTILGSRSRRDARRQ